MAKNRLNQNHENLEVRGARQNNLKNLDLDIPLNELTVITGVSGSGKSSLAFDTIYAEGQRRYVETFSPYARQFLDRMDRPQVDSIDNVPPAVAIDQVNPVRTTRSTVGTMTEINDHLKLLFARMASLYCPSCGNPVKQRTNDEICNAILDNFKDAHMIRIMFPIQVPSSFSTEYALEHLKNQGYTRIAYRQGETMLVVQDRIRLSIKNRSRLIEAIEVALLRGANTIVVQRLNQKGDGVGPEVEMTDRLRCCGVDFTASTPNLFSFNSAVGACETCRGFGKVIGIDYDQVIPDHNLSLRQGAIRAFNSPVYSESYYDLLEYGEESNIPLDTPWKFLSDEHRRWVIEGESYWYSGKWYGVENFFDWQEDRKHRMHVRVFLSHYRSYTTCPDCDGARLNPAAFNWRIGSQIEKNASFQKFRHPKFQMTDAAFENLPGLTVHDIASMPITRCVEFFSRIRLSDPANEAAVLLLEEIRARLNYLDKVGLGYLNLDRQSRTLSGGEVQRINLTTALGTTLVNTLFVLDEPTIGLHSRDIGRVIEILHRLRDAGNTLLIVEHEEQIIRAADKVADLGPGPGISGGNLVHFGTLSELLDSNESVTAACLRDGGYLPEIKSAPSSRHSEHSLTVRQAEQHNLRRIDVSFPLGQLVCVTGVSGSGKSTLIEEVLYRGVCRQLRKTSESPGRHHSIEGVRHINDIVIVSQAAIGKTTRSVPVTYVGALDPIRELFAQQPMARKLGYNESYFSFNTELGRCETCQGSGYEHIEMQFLSDVYLPCEDCDGDRFRPEVRQIKISSNQGPSAEKFPEPCSIVDVLNLTVADAIEFFGNDPDIVKVMEPLVDVGLDYLRLGQPTTTLSGGEAQRLKLAGHIAKKANIKRKRPEHIVFLFDEPTTGLHFTDVSKLISSFRKLIANGHSVIVIEHNLDLVSGADWVIDLGPEGGEFGGELVAEGTPATVAEKFSTATAEALQKYFSGKMRTNEADPTSAPAISSSQREICVHKAREHNLKNISVSIPYNAMTVITGMSGSGKSTLAFDILFAEGQKRYLATINAYARQFVQPTSRADFDLVTGLPPTVAISQMMTRGGRRSTVATLTEVYHYIRLLYVRFGTQYCPDCQIEVHSRTVESIVRQIIRERLNTQIYLFIPLVIARKGNHNQWYSWALNRGASYLLVDGKPRSMFNWKPLDQYSLHSIDMPVAHIELGPDEELARKELVSAIDRAMELRDGQLRVANALPDQSKFHNFTFYSTQSSCPRCEQAFLDLDPRMFSYNSSRGWCESCLGSGLVLQDHDEESDEWSGNDTEEICGACKGRRLNPQALAVRFHGITIDEMTRWSVSEARIRLSELKQSDRERIATKDILAELFSRLEFLEMVGLGYLSLNRAAPTLSGGESQRIRLAAQLGSSLCGACYVLDEPTIGLHSRDNQLLLSALHSLRDKGNTIVVVEHDEATIKSADHIIDLGPGGGSRGGEVVAQGSVAEICGNPASVTGRMLKAPLQHPMARNRSLPTPKDAIKIRGARLYNLKNVNVSFPVQSLVCVTGVSGSGKSTLVREVLYPNLLQALSQRQTEESDIRWDRCKEIAGWQKVRRVLEVNQTPIGKTPRSCPATYVNVWQTIRKLFAETAEARLRGYSSSRFSFNVAEGRCSVCSGQGEKKIEMNFLPDVRVLCETCGGARFNPETLGVRYRDKTIAQVLDLSVEEAQAFFSALPSLARVFGLLVEVGLGYLRLGQPSPTLSGGEAQRIKLVSELSKALPRNDHSKRSATKSGGSLGTLYVLDEPTVGLHAADVENLLKVIHALVDAGNMVVVIEHNLDVIAEADWIIDLGPEGGDDGGRVVVQGNLTKLIQSERSHTARAMRDFRRRTNVNVETKSLP